MLLSSFLIYSRNCNNILPCQPWYNCVFLQSFLLSLLSTTFPMPEKKKVPPHSCSWLPRPLLLSFRIKWTFDHCHYRPPSGVSFNWANSSLRLHQIARAVARTGQIVNMPHALFTFAVLLLFPAPENIIASAVLVPITGNSFCLSPITLHPNFSAGLWNLRNRKDGRVYQRANQHSSHYAPLAGLKPISQHWRGLVRRTHTVPPLAKRNTQKIDCPGYHILKVCRNKEIDLCLMFANSMSVRTEMNYDIRRLVSDFNIPLITNLQV